MHLSRCDEWNKHGVNEEDVEEEDGGEDRFSILFILINKSYIERTWIRI